MPRYKHLKFFVLPIVLMTCMNAFSQTAEWSWAGNTGGFFGDVCNNMKIDPASGLIFTTGNFRTNADIDPGAGTYYVQSQQEHDIYVSCLSPQGNLVWGFALTSLMINHSSYLAIDPSNGGKVFVVGIAGAGTDFDPGPNVMTLNNSGLFLACYSYAGNFVWVKGISGSLFPGINHPIATVASHQTVYISGSFGSTIDFDPSEEVNLQTATSNLDVFLCKFDMDGNFEWVQTQDVGIDYSSAIDADNEGNVFLTANYAPSNKNATYDFFISKISSSGAFLYTNLFEGYMNQFINSIAVDREGSDDYAITGYFDNDIDFIDGENFYILTTPLQSAFIARYSNDGEFEWAKSVGGEGAYAAGNHVEFPDSGGGSVFYSGYFFQNVDFDTGPSIFALFAPGNLQPFVSRLTQEGNFQWVITSTSQEGDTYSTHFEIKNEDEIFASAVWLGCNLALGDFMIQNFNYVDCDEDAFHAWIDASAFLAVDLVSFEATLTEQNDVVINWRTATEYNNHYFTVERSSDQQHFIPILREEGAGQSNHLLSYQATDSSPLPGANYYRLRQTDFDSKSNLSTIAKVIVPAASVDLILYPSPVDNKLTIAFDRRLSKSAIITIVDVHHQVVLIDRIQLDNGLEEIDVQTLTPGIYILQVQSEENVVVKKFLKKL